MPPVELEAFHFKGSKEPKPRKFTEILDGRIWKVRLEDYPDEAYTSQSQLAQAIRHEAKLDGRYCRIAFVLDGVVVQLQPADHVPRKNGKRKKGETHEGTT